MDVDSGRGPNGNDVRCGRMACARINTLARVSSLHPATVERGASPRRVKLDPDDPMLDPCMNDE